MLLPHFAEQFAANTFAACLAAGHDALRRGHDRDAQATLNALDLVAADVDAAAGTRDARQVADGRFSAAILQVHAEDELAFLFLCLVVGDVSLFFQNAGDLGLQLRGRNIQLLMAGPDGVPDARQKICYWVGQTHSFSFIPRSSAIAETCRNVSTVNSGQWTVIS